ncbi:MAG: SDR family NAD(P)-dependent oxidoreductase [Gammaproteobacteria bacterium]
MQDMQGRTAVVTGGAGGLGYGIAINLARAGMQVVLADLDEQATQQAAQRLSAAHGTRCLGVRCDVSDADSVHALADAAWSVFGGVDLLCNNAGVFVTGPIRELNLRDAQWLISVNVMGVINGCRIFLPRMIARGRGGHIMNTASEAGLGLLEVGIDVGIYSATKHAVVGLSDALRREAAPFGIGVSVLCPSGVRTQIATAARNRPDRYGGPAVASALPDQDPAAAEAAPQMMDPGEAGRLALAGIRENAFIIVTHASTASFTRTRASDVEKALERLAAHAGPA